MQNNSENLVLVLVRVNFVAVNCLDHVVRAFLGIKKIAYCRVAPMPRNCARILLYHGWPCQSNVEAFTIHYTASIKDQIAFKCPVHTLTLAIN